MLGENIDAESAVARGIVDFVVDDTNTAARAIAARIASGDPATMTAARRALRAATDLSLDDGLRRERLLAATARRSNPLS